MTNNRIHHRWGLAFEDETVPLMKAPFGSWYLTAKSFWKDTEDFENRVKTRSQLCKTLIVRESYITEHLTQIRNKINKKTNDNLITTETGSYPWAFHYNIWQ